MTAEATAADGAVLEAVAPILRVDDLAQALDYYQRVLGFQIAWTWGDPPSRASVCRDRVEVTVAQQPERRAADSSVYFSVRNVDAYYGRIVAAGADVTVPIGDRPYGMRDFAVADPSGNHLLFGEPTSS